MPLIDVRCTNGHEHEVYRAVSEWPKTPPCPTCAESTEQLMIPAPTRSTPDPVIVYKASDGSFRFPGDPNGLSAKTYEKQGMTRVELRGAADVRRFESQMTKQERSIAARKVETAHRNRELRESHLRSELRQKMASMSERGRDVARAAMRFNDNKPREGTKDPGFHVEAFSYNHSNRDESRDASGRRRRD